MEQLAGSVSARRGILGALASRPALGSLLFCAVVVWVASGVYMWHFGASWHLDLRVYRAAAIALVDHGAPYRALFTANHLPFTYPPFALLVFTPLRFGALGLVEATWWVLSSVALVATLYLLVPAAASGVTALRSGRLAIAALLAGVATLALEPVRSNMDYGQINLLLMWLVVADLHQTRGRFRGVLVALAAAVKLTPIVYLLFYLVRRDWRALGQGAATFVAVTPATFVVLPSESARYFLHEATDAARTGPVGSVSNQSLYGLFHRPPFVGSHLDVALWMGCVAVIVVLGALVARRLSALGRPLAESVLALALVELLISPISWSHHWSWMAVAPIAAVTLWSIDRRLAGVVALAIVTSVAAPYWWGVHERVGRFVADNALVLVGVWLLSQWASSLRTGRWQLLAARRPSNAKVRP